MARSQLQRRLVVTGVLLAVALATVVAVQRASGPGGPPASAAGSSRIHRSGTLVPSLDAPPPPAPEAGGQVPAHPADALDDLLGGRARALLVGDEAGWVAGLAPRSTAFAAAQRTLFERVRSLHPVAWSYQVAGGSALPPGRRAALGGTAWRAEVQLRYQLVAGGPSVHREQYLTVVGPGPGWRIAADTDGPTARDVWDQGPIAAATGRRCLVVGARARAAQVSRLAGDCGGAAATVDGAWGRGWPRRTVLTVPASLRRLADLLGRTPAAQGGEGTAGLDRTAAVTIGPADGPADGVLVNGQGFEQLSALGRRVVLTHELVHVATRATGARYAPTWLEEGYADYVAYRGTGLSSGQVAGDALAALRADGVPAHLPAGRDFDAAGDGASAAYGQAWVAVGVVAASAGGPAGLRTFYRRAAASPDAQARALDDALAGAGLGDPQAFTHRWQKRLQAESRRA